MQNVRRMVAWNDKHEIPESIRIMKISEELGEVTDAYIGMKGLNPRKGVTNGVDKVLTELTDVIITSMVAIESLGGNITDELKKRADFVVKRVEA